MSDPTPGEISINLSLTGLIFDHMVMNSAMIYDRQTQLPKPVPHTILPTALFEPIANRMVESQPVMQRLYAKVAMDHRFLLEHLKPMSTHDEYLKMLIGTLELNLDRTDSPVCLVSRSDFMIHEFVVVDDVIAPEEGSGVHNDHHHHHNSDTNPFGPILVNRTHYIPQQVEFNTMSTGLIGISQRVQRLHEYLLTSTELGLEPVLGSRELSRVGKFVPNLGQNGTAATLARGVEWFNKLLLSEAARLGLQSTTPPGFVMGAGTGSAAASPTTTSSSPTTATPTSSSSTTYPVPIVLMVTQENEFNVPDQRMIEYALRENHGIGLMRASLSQVEQNVSFVPLAKVFGNSDLDNHHQQNKMVPMWMGKVPIAVVYYRSCYTPTDFFMVDGEDEDQLKETVGQNGQFLSSSSSPSPIPLTPKQRRIQLYRNFEASIAVKCPNIGLFLSGMKKIQQLLTQREVLGRYLDSEDEIDMLQGLFAEIYSLQDVDMAAASSSATTTTTTTTTTTPTPSSSSSSSTPTPIIDHRQQRNRAIQSALADPDLWVLKPMREGGGNNLYGDDLRNALLEEDGASDCVLMRKIVTNENDYNVVSIPNSPPPPSSSTSATSTPTTTTTTTTNTNKSQAMCLPLIPEYGVTGGLFAEVVMSSHQSSQPSTSDGIDNDTDANGACNANIVDPGCQNGQCLLTNLRCDLLDVVAPVDIHLTNHSIPPNPQPHQNPTQHNQTQLCIRYNETFGVLVRTKRVESNEGGLAIGRAFVSSLIMIPTPKEDS